MCWRRYGGDEYIKDRINHTRKDIAGILGITSEDRVEQIEKRAIKKLAAIPELSRQKRLEDEDPPSPRFADKHRRNASARNDTGQGVE
jgi:hypothetical protein